MAALITSQRLRGLQWRAWRVHGALYDIAARRRAGFITTDAAPPLELHGEGTAAYRLLADSLGPDSLVYSCGVGCDTSFDESLIARYRLSVHAFDPTEQARDHVRASAAPDGFTFHPVAVGAADGEVAFSELVPGSHPVERAGTSSGLGWTRRSAPVPCRSLTSIMAEHGHSRLDVLKVDIEGAEYELLEHVLDAGIPVDQIVVEFHPFVVNMQHNRTMLGGRGWRVTAALVERLRGAGYAVVDVSPRGSEVSLAHRCLLDGHA